MKNNKELEHAHDHGGENIKIAFFLNLGFSILELVGGFLTKSISILSDAIHDFGDALSIGLSYMFEKKSKKLPDDKYTYGYLRYSLLGALITSFILLSGSVLVIYNAIPRIINPIDINHDGMIIFAIFGVLINGYAAYRTSKGKKTNEKAINLHMQEDVLGWIVVLIGSIFIKLFDLPIIDPILSIIMAIYILYHAYKYLREVFSIFMEKVPSDIDINSIRNQLIEEFSELDDVHHIHLWTMDNINNYLTAHIKLKKKTNETDIIKLKEKIKKKLNNENIKHVTLEIEYSNESCNKEKCKN